MWDYYPHHGLFILHHMACHCAYYTFQPSTTKKDFSINHSYTKSLKRSRPLLLSNVNNSRASYNTLVSEAVRLLVPPARFEASKLKVVYMGEEMNKCLEIIPRSYILSHCDFTANLTLTISMITSI
ncbi:magnesium dechelatase SGRL, chloroplastic-like [Tripterygium wilfordii]|uniref:magnesium dechelatase SGRL, chloroplastic-like n=1 Tax=Tripterygium wilfordii TaxID=458696 RepID=UPI0018F837BB|nr:magnesium dechelatase SGRL, chloroplastic-like [Tripterygium wilfordii]